MLSLKSVPSGETKENTQEEARAGGRSGPEIPGLFVPNDSSSGPKTRETKQASANIQGQEVKGQSELCQEKSGSSVGGGWWVGGDMNTKGQLEWWSLSRENASKQESGPSSWEDPGRCP